ncbi:hypothetical protein [Bdellovibrio bacteriovorus]|uniref:Uncharacterized protein n=1 Tax=Bdellovibrio bacteriovorus str. Tiberius TaxID=1069642 RepID=K7ZEC8_BDEBC|nr:hypothetical protein [Bdellovibrio bacteriovorus]AFY00347.1 Hypothetical protein Bdt_0639 [Bdellovibrio bacteriovorus str. Tiberius]
MKTMILAGVMVVAASVAQASDGQVLFHCESLPTVDSALTVMGVADEITADVDVVVMVAGQVKTQDRGGLLEGATRFEGQIFDIEFDHVTRIIAKQANEVLSVGQADSLVCTYPSLP